MTIFARVARCTYLAVAAGLLLTEACGSDSTPAVTGGAGVAEQAVAGSSGSPSAAAGTAPSDTAGGSALGGQGGAGDSGTAGVSGGAGAVTALGGSAGVVGMAGSGGVGHAGTGGSGMAGAPPVKLDPTLLMRVTAGAIPLQAWYNTNTGLFDKNDWWTSANQLEAIIDYTRETGDMKYFGDIENTFVKNQASNFDRYGYYDDDGWWAIVWIKAYDLSHQQKYLDMAKTIFKRMAGGWDTRCGGGIYWNTKKNKKNAIPNTLFMQAAAKLHLRTPGDAGAGSYLEWAQRTWAWFKGSGLLQSNKLIRDSLDNLNDCKGAGPIFTYNQGVAVGALTDLAASTADTTLLDEASAIAHATMSSMAVNGILKEAGCGGEVCTQFKGVFFRNLLLFYRTRPATDLQAYMRTNCNQIWNVSRNGQNRFGYQWHLPFDGASVMRQSSALDELIATYAASNPLP